MFSFKRFVITRLSWTVLFFLAANFAMANNSVIGINLGLIQSQHSASYIDTPYDVWPDRKADFLFSGQYYWKFSETFFAGAYGEFETLSYEFTDYNQIPEQKVSKDGSKFGVGISWLGRTGALIFQKLGMQFGGKFGFAVASLKDADVMNGLEFAIFFGPFFSLTPTMQLAVQFGYAYGWYHGDTDPEGLQNHRPIVELGYYLEL